MNATAIRHNTAHPTPAEAIDMAACNTCGARIGEGCTTPTGRKARAHTDRVDRAWSVAINQAYIAQKHNS